MIRKHNKDKDFTIIDNNIFKNSELTLKAKGLLCLMLSLQDGWEFSNSGLSKLSKDGIDSVKSGLDELEEQGYLIREYTRVNGRFGNVVFNLYEIPHHSGKTVNGKTVAEKPSTEIPHNKELNNKGLSNKELINKTIGRFNEFYDSYPKKVSKGQAEKTFSKLVKDKVIDDVVLDKIIADLKKREFFDGWKDRKYIPNPSTYLNNYGWLDEYNVSEQKEEIHINIERYE